LITKTELTVPSVVEAFQTGPRKVIFRTDSLCSCRNVKTTIVISLHIHEKFNFQTRTVHSPEACDHLGYYAAYSCNSLQTFRDNLSVPSSRVQLSSILGLLDPQGPEITHCSQYTVSWSAGQHLHTWCCQTQVPSLTEAIPLCSNKVV